MEYTRLNPECGVVLNALEVDADYRLVGRYISYLVMERAGYAKVFRSKIILVEWNLHFQGCECHLQHAPQGESPGEG